MIQKISNMAAKSWYLLYTKPRQESIALDNLRRQSFETYCPLVKRLQKKNVRKALAATPMFPRYLFIHLDTESDDWGPIRSTLGVVSMVRFGPRAARAPEGLIEALRQREDEQGFQPLPAQQYQPGDQLRITDGPLSGYEGIFLAKSGHDRVTLLLDIFGRHARTAVAVEATEPK